MEVFSAALPNVMFLVGMAALSIGLGIELKIVPVGNQVGKSGRVGAMVVGALLVVASVFLYIRPASLASTPAVPTAAAAALTGVASAQPTAAPALLVVTATTEPPTAIPVVVVVTATPPPATETLEPSATTVSPTQTALPPTATLEPTATAVPPTATVAGVLVPDIHGMNDKEAKKMLAELGLRGEKKDSCEELEEPRSETQPADKGRVTCQSPPPGNSVALGARVYFVLADGKGD